MTAILNDNRKTGLFSAVVAAFIIEGYKKLSPDSGDETVALLRQISQQLASSANGALPSQAAMQPPSSTAAIVCVNVMWLISLVLSITSALFATLLQQWARRYVQKPQIPRVPKQRARVRSFLHVGTEKFKMRAVVDVAPTLLHLSVFLFFVGLGIFFVPIHKIVGIIVSIVVGLFGLAYLVLTILPCIKHNCPYRTPMTVFYWYSWHAVLFCVARCRRRAVQLLHGWLVPLNLGENLSLRQQTLVRWFESCEAVVQKHRDCLKHGLDKITIFEGAKKVPVNEDCKMLTWLLNRLALVDNGKLRRFMATIPRNTIVQLMTPPIESGKMVLREPLLTLVRTCAGTIAVGFDDYVRRCSLFVCLEAVRHVAEALVDPNAYPQPEVLCDVRIHFANISLMRAMWADADTAIRVTSRSICALLARCLMRRGQLEGPELAWLEFVTGEPSNTIFKSLGDNPTLERMNLKSFVYGVLSPHMGELSTEHAASFERTLAILMGALTQTDLDRTALRTGLQNLIQQMEDAGDHDSIAVSALRQIQQNIPQPIASTS